MSGRYLVYGLAVAGAAVVRAATGRGIDVVVVDDSAPDGRRALAAELGVELVVAPSPDGLDSLVAACDVVVPAPGVPETHALFAAARRHGRPVHSEL